MEGRVRRVEVPRSLAAARTSGNGRNDAYASAFALALVGAAEPRPAEQWARAVFEGAPRLLRGFVLFGWRSFLRLRLQPLEAADQVLGWRLERHAAGPDTVTLAAASPLLRAENVVAADGTIVLWVTVVHFEGRAGRLLWTVASALHHVIIPYLLGLAARVGTIGRT
jgi:hypothetical protein